MAVTIPPRRVRVTIDRLVLNGFPAAQRDAIAASLVAELERQLTEDAHQHGSFDQGRAVAVQRLPPLRPAQGASATDVGTSAAQSVARSLGS